jgi:hypothetical protein
MDIYITSLLKQQSTGRLVAPIGYHYHNYFFHDLLLKTTAHLVLNNNHLLKHNERKRNKGKIIAVSHLTINVRSPIMNGENMLFRESFIICKTIIGNPRLITPR